MVWKNTKHKSLAGSSVSSQNRRILSRKAKPIRRKRWRLRGRIITISKRIRTKFAWSFWGQRIIKAFMRGGKKKVALAGLGRALILLRHWTRGSRRRAFGVMFEAIEAMRPTLYAIERTRGRRKIVITSVLPWWKQYSVALRWFRHQLNLKSRSHMAWAIASEVRDCLTTPERSKLLAKRYAMYELASRSRIRQHFRW